MLVLICISQGMACILLLVCMKPTNTPCLRLVRLAFPMITETGFPSPDSNCCISSILPLYLFINSFASLVPKMHGSDEWWCLIALLPSSTLRLTPSSPLRAYLSIHCLERYKKKPCPPSLLEYISFHYITSSASYLHYLLVDIVSLHLHVPTDTQLEGNTLHSKPHPP
ncbi:hypothetical protein GGI35DRAFT_318441 [Trichoderma velutinum]